MPLLSAYEDFCERTLGALNGVWKKLEFVSGLKAEKGHYEHWGLKYTYGPVQANRAMAQAHSEAFQKVLETPIPTLDRELKDTGGKDAAERPEQYVPEDRNGCAAEHFEYVLKALNLLAASRSNHQAA